MAWHYMRVSKTNYFNLRPGPCFMFHIPQLSYRSNSYAEMESLHWRFETIWAATWDFQQCGMCNQQSLRSACAYAQSDQNLCKSLEYSMSVKLLTEHHLEFLSLKGGCTGLSVSTLVKIPHFWKSHVAAHLSFSLKTHKTRTHSLAHHCKSPRSRRNLMVIDPLTPFQGH